MLAILLGALLASSVPNAGCLSCHGAAPLGGDRIHIDRALFARSTHGRLACAACHAGAETIPHRMIASVSCAACHPDGRLAPPEFHRRTLRDLAVESGAIVHGGGETGVPTCGDCHGAGEARGGEDPASPVHPARVAGTCLACHGDAVFARARGISIRLAPETYARSVHGRPAPARDLAVAANCVDCHGSHRILPRSDPASPIAQVRVAATCGRCHRAEADDYLASSHGRAVLGGAHESPTCTDCHGEHGILSPRDPASPTHRLRTAQEICLACHDRPALQEKFGLPGRRGATYLDSYHGLALRGRSTVAAVCTDCHGVHRILGAGDTAASIHPANRTATCARCHLDATDRFAAAGPVHAGYADHWATALVRRFYRILIPATLGGMLMWVGILLIPALRRRVASAGEGAPVRFRAVERIQHAILAVSFVLLAGTGFVLAAPESSPARAAARLGLDEGLRGDLHRAAGMALLLAGLWHVDMLLRTRRGRWLLARLRPKRGDLSAARAHLAHALGRGPAPIHGHFSYFEKVEYWALVWGTLLMGATGLILWFPERLPRLLVSLSEAVHFYEAILAVGAILIWHLFFVSLDPEVFPINPSIFTGRAPRGSDLAERTEESGEKKE